jgi:O-antigen/teichoic acid export membrane protein
MMPLKSQPRRGGLLNEAAIFGVAGIIGQCFGIVTIALFARNLGANDFGLLSLVVSAVKIVESLASRQSLQAFLQYAPSPIDCRNADLSMAATFKLCLRECVRGDILGILLGCIVVLPTTLAAWLLEMITADTATLVAVYACSMCFGGAQTLQAVTRWSEDIGLQCLQRLLPPVAKALGIGALMSYGPEIGVVPGHEGGLLLVSIVVMTAIDLSLLGIFAYITWSQCAPIWRRLAGRHSAEVQDISEKFRAFSVMAFRHNAVKSITRDGDVLLAGATLDVASVGVYKTIKQVGAAAVSLASPLALIAHARLVKSVRAGDYAQFKSIMTTVSLLGAVGGACALALYAVFSDVIASVLFGGPRPGFSSAGFWYLCGSCISLIGGSAHPALLALGRNHDSLRSLVTSTTIFVLAVLVMGPHYGLVGFCASYMIFYVVWLLMQAKYLGNAVRQGTWNTAGRT